eukprot:Lithocolla_globosa_v1_NODE_510_length_3870_cov_6.511402.p1 type:complete len:1224 gc:universal NODE_510_length_3870_cov_6.511402:190-3861(+)
MVREEIELQDAKREGPSSFSSDTSKGNLLQEPQLDNLVNANFKSANDEVESEWSPQPKKDTYYSLFMSWLGNFDTATRYVVSDTKKHKRSFTIGVSTVLIVVAFMGLIQNTLLRSAIIFVKLAEDTVGQYDLLFYPDFSGENIGFFNWTEYNLTLKDSEAIHALAPRWIFFANVSNPEFDNRTSGTLILVLDTEYEEQVGLGTAWPHRVLGNNEAHMTTSLCQFLHLEPDRGQQLRLSLDLLAFSSSIGFIEEGDSLSDAINLAIAQANGGTVPEVAVSDLEVILTDPDSPVSQSLVLLGLDGQTIFNGLSDYAEQEETISLGQILASTLQPTDGNSSQPVELSQLFTLVSNVDLPAGKYPPALGNVILVDQKEIERLIKENLQTLLTNPISQAFLQNLTIDTDSIENFKLTDYSFSMVGLYKDRMDLWSLNTEDRRRLIIEKTDEMVKWLGLDSAGDWDSPLDSALEAIGFIRLFLNEIFFACNGVLFLLAVLLVYSLLLSDVEEKTYEYGMLRTLGLRQSILILLLTIQTLYFSFPGIITGFLVLFVIYLPAELLISSWVVTPIDISFQQQTIRVMLLVGIILPFFGMLLPIRKALGKTLRDALDVYHNQSYDSIVRIQKLEDLNVNFLEILLAVCTVGLGFMVYYLIPLSFLFFNIPLFLRVLSLILILMVFGQILMSQLVDQPLQRLVVNLIMWGQDRIVKNIVIRNLAGHRGRNKKTSVMFIMCTGFIIFAAVMFFLQAESLPQNLEWLQGADMVVQVYDYDNPLPEDDLRKLLEGINQDYGRDLVLDYTFITFDIRKDDIMKDIHISGISTVRESDVEIYGVEKNFLNVAYNDYVLIQEKDENLRYQETYAGVPDVIEPLHWDFNGGETVTSPDIFLTRRGNETEIQKDVENLQVETDFYYNRKIPALIASALQDSAFLGVNTRTMLLFDHVYNYTYEIEDGFFGDDDDGDDNQEVSNIATRLEKRRFFSLVKPIALMRKMPAFFGYNRLQFDYTPVLISLPYYKYILKEVNQRTNLYTDPSVDQSEIDDTPKKATLLIRFVPDIPQYYVVAISYQLAAIVNSVDGQVFNVLDQVAQTTRASQLIIFFFDIVAIVGLIFCFFVLWLSFTANVRENSWEYGVLRALGLTSGSVLRLYIYEALSIVISSLILGGSIGIVTAIVLTLQINIFTEQAFVFNFPTTFFLLIVVVSLSLAVIGSYTPAKEFQKKSIAVALKGN